MDNIETVIFSISERLTESETVSFRHPFGLS